MNELLFQTEANRLKPSEAYVVAANGILHDLIYSTSGIDGVLLASVDGFEVNSIFRKKYDAGKLSAVGSSILALVQAFTSAAHLSNCRSILLDTEDGKMMLSAVANKNQPMILTIITGQQVMLGQIIHSMSKAIRQLIELDEQLHNL